METVTCCEELQKSYVSVENISIIIFNRSWGGGLLIVFYLYKIVLYCMKTNIHSIENVYITHVYIKISFM